MFYLFFSLIKNLHKSNLSYVDTPKYTKKSVLELTIAIINIALILEASFFLSLKMF